MALKDNQSVSGVTVIQMPCHGIRVELFSTAEGARGGCVTSELSEDPAKAPDHYCAAVDMLEALILAHAAAGVDVLAPAYVEGVETAVEGLLNEDEAGI